MLEVKIGLKDVYLKQINIVGSVIWPKKAHGHVATLMRLTIISALAKESLLKFLVKMNIC